MRVARTSVVLLAAVGTLATLGMESVSRIASLRHFDLSAGTSLPSVTDEGVKHLTNLENLQVLHFASPQVTDLGFGYICQIKSLRYMGISIPRLTDTGLQQLAWVPKYRADSRQAAWYRNDAPVRAEISVSR